MVKLHHVILDWSIKNTKMRIKHFEKHGEGNNVMQEKANLKKMERRKELQKR